MNLLKDNTPEAKCVRTILQGVIGALMGIVTYLSGVCSEWVSICVCPFFMAIASPLMALLGGEENGSSTQDLEQEEN